MSKQIAYLPRNNAAAGEAAEQLRNVYCGPWAVMALTGARIADVYKQINKYRGSKPDARIVGTSVSECVYAIRQLGRFTTDNLSFHMEGTPTLAQFGKGAADGVYLVRTSGHILAMRVVGSSIQVSDTFTKNEKNWHALVSKHPRRRTRITHAVKVERVS